MKYKELVEFPCGFRHTIEFTSGIFDIFSVDNKKSNESIEKNGCPIHGKNCCKSQFLGKVKQ